MSKIVYIVQTSYNQYNKAQQAYNNEEIFHAFESLEIAKQYALARSFTLSCDKTHELYTFPVFIVEINDNIESTKTNISEQNIRILPTKRDTNAAITWVTDDIPQGEYQTINKRNVIKLCGFIQNNMHYYKKTKGSYYRALNPNSQRSGIYYSLVKDCFFQNYEMPDKTIGEQIIALDKNKLLDPIMLFQLLHGNHYDITKTGHGRKGLLDFLLFPLLTRKIIADLFLPKKPIQDPLMLRGIFLENLLIFLVVLPVALLFECLRLFLAIALTLALWVPIVLTQGAVIAITTNDGFAAIDFDEMAEVVDQVM